MTSMTMHRGWTQGVMWHARKLDNLQIVNIKEACLNVKTSCNFMNIKNRNTILSVMGIGGRHLFRDDVCWEETPVMLYILRACVSVRLTAMGRRVRSFVTAAGHGVTTHHCSSPLPGGSWELFSFPLQPSRRYQSGGLKVIRRKERKGEKQLVKSLSLLYIKEFIICTNYRIEFFWDIK